MTIRDNLITAATDLRSLADRVLPRRQDEIPLSRAAAASEIRQIADRLQSWTEPTQEPSGEGGQQG